jgi:hypothetical protein
MAEADPPVPDAPDASQDMARVRAIVGELEELELRLTGSSSGEVELSLLERATVLVEEARLLLERLVRVTG